MTDMPSLVLYVLCVNALTIGAFFYDKQMAERYGRRVPEKTLLTLALMGGSPGALWARRAFRHKTLKEPFSTHLKLIVVVQIIGLLAYSY